MNKEYDKEINKVLFGIDTFSQSMSYDDIENKMSEASKVVKRLVDKFGYQLVFDSWLNYLKENIHSNREAWNFMILFFNYDGHKFKVKDPYPFLGMLYKKLGLSFEKDPKEEDGIQVNDTFDSIYIELLLNSGVVKSNAYFYMNPYNDEKLIEAYKRVK